MIHLDRNHHPSPLSPHSNSNLILPTAHTDQLKLLSRSPLTRDERPAQQDQPQEHYVAESDSLFEVDSTSLLGQYEYEKEKITEDDVIASTISPDASLQFEVDPIHDFANHQFEAEPLSPNDQRSSSLSPPPDSGSPKPVDVSSPPVPSEEVQQTVPEAIAVEETAFEETIPEPTEATVATPVDGPHAEPSSRHSTPLSELSPPSEHEELPEGNAEYDVNVTVPPVVVSDADANGMVTDVELPTPSENEAKVEVVEEELGHEEKQEDTSTVSPPLDQRSLTAVSPQPPADPPGLTPAPEAVSKPASIPGQMSTEPTPSIATPSAPSKPSPTAPEKHPVPQRAPSQEGRSLSRQPSVTRPSTSGTPVPSTDKGVRLLELNHELLKVCMEFQAHGIPMSDARAQEYATRLQGNLTWLASAADGHRQGMPPLPPMEPPADVDFASMERIKQLYADLPTMFAREIARRQQSIPSKPPSLPPSTPVNPSLKRDRPEEIETNIANKRRDTGESKSPPMRPPTVPPTPSMMGSPMTASFPMSNSPTMNPMGNMTHPPQPPMGMPSIAPPSLPQGMPSGGSATEAQIAAAQRERARQMQIQQARQQQQQQLQQQQQQLNARQMSPPSIPSSAQMPGQSQPQNLAGPSNMSNINMSSPAAINAFGPNAAQNMQILQNSNHPFVQYLNQKFPGFGTLPLPQQLQRMHHTQTALHQQRQDQHVPGQQQRPMPSMPQQAMQPLQNNGMRGPQFGGATSPTSNQVSMGQQQQQQPQNGNFPFAQNQMNPGGGGGATAPNPAMMGNMNQMNMNMNALTPQQRQLLMMQQQQQQNRAGNNGNGAMMNNPDAYAMVQERYRQEQQQRLSQQAGLNNNAGSPPMSAGAGSDIFPALRSNSSSIPGIARSTRSPSDGAASPMSPQISRGPQQDMRRMMSGGANGMGGGVGGFSPQLPNWQQKNQQTQQPMPMGHLQPPSYGGGGVGGGGGGGQNWNGYPLAPSPNSGGYQPERTHTPRQSSLTPVPPQQQMQPLAHSPPPQQQHNSPNEFELFNWNGQ